MFAFLDILGFERLVNESRSNPMLISKIANILTRSKQIALSSMKTKLSILQVDPTQYKYRAFSDTSVISGPYTSHDDMIFLSWWVMHYEYLMWKEERTFVRGAIVYGDIYEDEEVVFGPALIDAYNLEKSGAVWPRVLIDRSLLDKATETERARDLLEFLTQDDVKMVYVDYLRQLFHLFVVAEKHRITGERKEGLGAPVGLFKYHKQAILAQRENALKEENRSKRKEIIQKYVELSKYHNSTVSRFRQITQDLMNNNDFVCDVFEDRIESDRAGAIYTPKYNAQEHPEQSDMLDILGVVTNALLEKPDILQTHGIVTLGQTDHDKLAGVLRTLYRETPRELSALDKTLKDSMVNIKA